MKTILARIPENTSFLQKNKFSFVFPTLPFLKYFVQTAVLPSISTNAVVQPSPFARSYRHGDTLNYDSFNITTLVDEDMRVYQETHDWMRALTKPQEYEQYARFFDSNQKLYHDAILTINTNANNPNIRYLFRNCHPTTMSQIDFDSRSTADETMTLEITFQYDFFEIERVNS